MRKQIICSVMTLVVLSWACHKKHLPDKSTAQRQLFETGFASYYADKFIGKKTASGQLYDANKFTAAHRKIAFGTRVSITNMQNGKTVEVIINDRGPFVSNRIIDVSKAAAKALGMLNAGVIKVQLAYY